MSNTIELKESPHLRAETSITQYADALMLSSTKTKQTNIVLKKLLHVVLLAGVFMILEVIGGVIADSIAILSDAAHMLSDVLGFAISIISVWISSFPANERNSFGFHRAGVIGALASTVLIWILTGFLVYEAIVRILNIDDVQLNSKVMLVTAIFGLGTNLVMVKVLHGDEHGHSHGGHSHGHSHDNAHKHSDSHSPPTKKSSSKSGQNNYYLYNDEENNQTENKSREKGHDSCCGGHEHAHSHVQHVYSPDPKAKQKQGNESVSTHLRSDSEGPELTGISANSPPKEKENEYAFTDAEDHHSHRDHSHAHGHDHDHHSHNDHSHGHGHGHDACCHDDLNIRAAAIHIMGDILQSIGVIIGSIIILFSPETFKIIDPILTLVFSIIVLFTTKRVLTDCLSVIMQSTPDMYYLSDMTDLFERIPHVVRVHNIHMWSLTMGKPVLSAHVVVDGEGSAVLAQITQVCRKYKIFHSTIQIENQNEETKNLIDCNHNIC